MDDQTAKFFKEWKLADPLNLKCGEPSCLKSNPQWASVTYGMAICYQCAGKHRGLGTHLSFVRSLTMDTWSQKQLNQMKVGGNTKCRAWFEKHGLGSTGNLKAKYTSAAAEMYKDKIKTEASGAKWTPPTKEELEKRKRNNQRSGYARNYGRGNARGTPQNAAKRSPQHGRQQRPRKDNHRQQAAKSEWDNWGQPVNRAPAPNRAQAPAQRGSGQMSATSRFANNRAISSDAFFDREPQSNVGNASNGYQDSAIMDKLSVGWNSVSSALQYGAQAVAAGSRSLSEQVAKTDLNSKIQSLSIAAKEQSTKAWTGIATMWDQAQKQWVAQDSKEERPLRGNGGVVKSTYTPPQSHSSSYAGTVPNDEPPIEVIGKRDSGFRAYESKPPTQSLSASGNLIDMGTDDNTSNGNSNGQHNIFAPKVETAKAPSTRSANDTLYDWEDTKASTAPASTIPKAEKTNMSDWGWDDDW